MFKKEIKIILEFKATLRNHPATLKEQERKSLSSAQRILSTNEVHSYDTLSHHKLKNNNFEQTTENMQNKNGDFKCTAMHKIGCKNNYIFSMHAS